MSVATAIGSVSESLQSLLDDEMTLSPPVAITLLAPDEHADERRVNLFLYKVQENSFLKNAAWQADRTAPGRLAPPPLSLSLFYLMTAYARSVDEGGNATAHQILGEAMRVFYENPVVPQPNLMGDLDVAREELRIMLNVTDVMELSQVWSTFSKPYRPSVMYEVSLVQLDMSAAKGRSLPRRVRTIGTPEVTAPYQPPVITDMRPSSGPSGTAVSFSGENLEGWQAYVRIFDQRVLDARPLTRNQFSMTIPPGLPQGFHRVRVDVSHLARATFFFEVT